jgi:uncharacterized lipoprotein NlpE involved in copper resistance
MGSGAVHSLMGGDNRGDMVRIQGVELDEIYEFAKRGIVMVNGEGLAEIIEILRGYQRIQNEQAKKIRKLVDRIRELQREVNRG